MELEYHREANSSSQSIYPMTISHMICVEISLRYELPNVCIVQTRFVVHSLLSYLKYNIVQGTDFWREPRLNFIKKPDSRILIFTDMVWYSIT